jgi:ATP-binding cassette subfamily F protein 3
MEALNLNNTILEEMKEFGAQKTELELRTLLGCFLFGGDDIDKKIKVLSGGEKARVALAKTMISKANFLLLDEPTNHLDIHSSELLINALNRYEGSYILVSHDRYFISKTANKIWEIVDYQIKEFKGTYEEWAAWKERAEKANVEKEQKRFKQLEADLARLNDQKADIEKKLASPEIYQHAEKFKQTEASYQQLLMQINEANSQYEAVFEKIILLESA